MKQNQIIITVIVAVIVGFAGFFGGMQYQKNQRASMFANGNFGNGQGGNGGFGRRFGGQFGGPNGQAVRGEVVSVDANGITVKLRDGSTKIVILPSSATVMKATAGSKGDVTAGQQVMVFGTNNSDGSVTAQVVQLNPLQMGRPSGATPSAAPSATQKSY